MRIISGFWQEKSWFDMQKNYLIPPKSIKNQVTNPLICGIVKVLARRQGGAQGKGFDEYGDSECYDSEHESIC